MKISDSESLLQSLSFDFAINIIQTSKTLIEVHKEFILSKQLLKSGTAIGALIREAAFAQSKADFVSKMSIALKEANETEYWLLLLFKTNYLNEHTTEELLNKNKSLIRMLIATVKTAKSNLKPK